MNPNQSFGQYDIIIVGGGLWGQLTLHFFKTFFPKTAIALIEQQPQLAHGKNWSCHTSDIPASLNNWYRSLPAKEWPGQTVQFKTYDRHLNNGYCTLKANDLSAKTMSVYADCIYLNFSESQLPAESNKAWIIDTKNRAAAASNGGFQKFVGLLLRTTAPHNVEEPIIMDARVPQKNGFRFFYSLPFSKQDLFIEDTRYSLTDNIEIEDYKKEILEYAEQKLKVKDYKIIETEVGCLPIPFHPQIQQQQVDKHIYLGAGAGLFQPVTGYSLPYAFEFLNLLLQSQGDLPRTFKHYLDWQKKIQQRQKMFYYLNRLLFLAADREKEYLCFERFYTFNEKRIERFYNGQFSKLDWLAMFSGRPPVSVIKAIKVTWDGVFA
ncbi:MAG: lycopene beta-cyclase CrtY [Sediminibacterium sp.]|jgi:lycopene beta-cyclase|nr:lycopene beta-cyclase CrtY [Sediminibacterium sp.]